MSTCATETFTYSGHQLLRLSESPSIWLAPDFLTDEECQHIIETARPTMRPSTVISQENGSSIRLDDKRTSTNTFLKVGSDPVIIAIEERIAKLLKVPVSHGEDLQVLNYQPGQEYVPHCDFFRPTVPNMEKEYPRGGQRLVTVLMYLNDVEAGGETHFPKLDLHVPPQKRSALIFYNLFGTGEPDPDTLHAGTPVIQGEKWAMTKWLRERPFNPQAGR